LSALLHDVKSAQRCDDLLTHGLAPSLTACNLQIAVAFGGFDSEKHQRIVGLRTE
jgi:hypothetical protein